MVRCGWVLLLGLGGCDDVIFGQAVGGEVEPPATTGWAGVQEIIADSTCLGCHSAAGAQGGLDLETDPHGSTVNVVGQYGIPIVSAGDPDNSILLLKVTNTHPSGSGGDMPPGSGGIDAGRATIIEDWIVDGAPSQ